MGVRSKFPLSHVPVSVDGYPPIRRPPSSAHTSQVRGTRRTQLSNEPLPALFGLETLYALQPAETRSVHVARIQEHHAELVERVGWVNLLREDRSIGLEEAEASPEFWSWAEENEDTTDQVLDELVRSLGLQAHAALAQLSLAGLTERTLLLRSRKQGDGALHA